MNLQMTCSQRQWLHSSVGRASHRYREVTGSNPVEVRNFFQASLRNCINCVHCDDHFFIFKDANFDHDLLKTAEEIAPQSHRILQTFVWWRWTSLFPPPPLPHHTHVCKISRLCGETIFVRF